MNNNLIVVSLLSVFSFTKLQAQVGIGTTTPNSSAILHLNDPKKGLLLTSIALISSSDNITIPSPAIGLLIWNNGTGGLSPAGLYYWNNSQWNIVSAGNNSSNGDGWNTTGGNAGSGSGANTAMSFGTTSFDDLVFKTNNIVSGRLGVNNSVLFGSGTSASQNAVAIGTNAKADSNESTAVGYNSSAAGYQSLAMGYNAKTTSNSETAVGFNAQTSGQNSTALGSGSKGLGQNSIALGYEAQTTSFNSTALGSNSKGLGQNSTALGYNSQASALNSTAIGSGSSAGGQNSTAIGSGATSNQANAIVLGDSNANIGIGTNTPNTTVKIDVNGQYKLGEKGTVQKNQISFEVWPSVSINNLQSGRTATINIAIPTALQINSNRATIVVSPANDFAGNLEFGISNPRMTSASNITFNVTNISNGNASLNSGHFYVTINEF